MEARMRYRREDSDAAGDRYRLYEIAGPGHLGAVPASVVRADGFDPPPAGRWTPSDFPIHYFLMAAWRNLFRWVEEGTPPPRADRIEIDEATMKVVVDEHGNACGGIRSPQLDVPAARYRGMTPGMCLLGLKEPFDQAKLTELYGDHATYARRVADRADELVAGGWLLPAQAEAIKADAAAVAI
jgi:hypothetical protein